MAQPQIKLSDSRSTAAIVRVLEVGPEDLLVTALSGPSNPWRVRCGLAPNIGLRPGLELVVVGCPEGQVAIACLRAPQKSSQTLADGTLVQVDGASGTVDVMRADGSLLFHYDAIAGRGTIRLENESLDLLASKGDMNLSAAGEIRLRARSVFASASMKGATSSLELAPGRAGITTEALQLRADELLFEAAHSTLRGGELRAELKRAVIGVERLETVAEVVVSTARTLYQTVHELLQQRVGSLRTLVSGTAQLSARSVTHRAADTYKVRGEKIHLG
ncbi:MAG: hypothetical protein RLZZ450_1292 [Pseudomonadota bacterium]|jgi:hypothetical protein